MRGRDLASFAAEASCWPSCSGCRLGGLIHASTLSCRPAPHVSAGPAGLLYDRCWALVDAGGAALRLKQHPGLARISACVDLQRRVMLVSAPGEEQPLHVPLPELVELPGSSGRGGGSRDSGSGSSDDAGSPPGAFSVRVCSRTAWVQRAGSAAGGEAEASAWFSRALGVPCRLVVQQGSGDSDSKHAAPAGHAQAGASSSSKGSGGSSRQQGGSTRRGSGQPGGSFANEGQLLVLGAASLADLAARCGSAEPPDTFAQRFRWACGRLAFALACAFLAPAAPAALLPETAVPACQPGLARPRLADQHPLLPAPPLLRPAPPCPTPCSLLLPCRPNLVVAGTRPYAEDGWAALRLRAAPAPTAHPAAAAAAGAERPAAPAVAEERQQQGQQQGSGGGGGGQGGEVELEAVGRCARCDMVCSDPLTGRCGGWEERGTALPSWLLLGALRDARSWREHERGLLRGPGTASPTSLMPRRPRAPACWPAGAPAQSRS